MSNTEINTATNTNTTNNNNNNNNNNEQKETSTNSPTNMPLEIRFLIENASVGGLIGKAGANVQRVRDESGASVSILKSDGRQYHERILIMRGSVEQMARAVAMLCELLVEAAKEREKREFEEQSQNNTNDSSLPSDQVTLRLLVHKSAVGAVIGRSGAVIKETQTETNARVQVSNDALPGSTEKTVTISGVPSAVFKAFTRVAQQLKDNPLKSNIRNIPYTPGHHNGRHAPHSQFVPYPNPINGPIGPTSTQKIAIPTVCAGCIIGKGGSVIRDLRAQSGTNISISVPDPLSPSERVVTLTGSPQGIQTAVYLIRQLVEQYQPAPNQREQR
jgi:heterogeneous nuclear rnp K-like protein 2